MTLKMNLRLKKLLLLPEVPQTYPYPYKNIKKSLGKELVS